MIETSMSTKITGNDYNCAEKYGQFLYAKIHIC